MVDRGDKKGGSWDRKGGSWGYEVWLMGIRRVGHGI